MRRTGRVAGNPFVDGPCRFTGLLRRAAATQIGEQPRERPARGRPFREYPAVLCRGRFLLLAPGGLLAFLLLGLVPRRGAIHQLDQRHRGIVALAEAVIEDETVTD